MNSINPSLPSEATPGLFEAQTDVGAVSLPGSCLYDFEQQTYTITGSGANIWHDHDAFHFVWKLLTGDFIVTMRAEFVGPGVQPHRKLGWMARASLDANSPHVSTGIHGDGLNSLQFRRTPGGMTEEVVSPVKGADVIQLERQGDTFIMSVAHYGDTLTTTEVADLALSDEVYVGIFICAHDDQIIEQATCQNVRIVEPVQANFVRQRDPLASNLELLEIESGRRRIIYQTPDILEAPNWTLDGQALIYNRHGRLYRFDLAERKSTLIDTDFATRCNNDHVISFDGTMLAISHQSEPENVSIVYTVPIEGGQPKRITDQGPSYLHGWSPDGKFLVYTGRRNSDFDIYRISVDGGEETQLTTAPGLDDGPEYTPDGRYIYFNSVRSGRMQIWRMKPDGSQQEQLTDDEYNNWFPHISPDGRWIAFLTYLPHEVEPSDHPPAKRVYLRLMPLDGGQPKVLAYLYGGQGTMNVPSWSPDSKQIAFVSNTVRL